MSTIAFLGIGLMGRPMAVRLAGAGYRVRAWNRTFPKAEALRGSGAQVVISILDAGPAMGAVIEAALPALAPDTLWIDMSSTRQDEALAFQARLATSGCRFMDAPVSGGVGEISPRYRKPSRP